MPVPFDETYSALPQDFRQRIAGTFGADGRHWLHALPRLLEDCEARWRLKIGPPLTPLSYNYIAPATMGDGQEIILKLGVPNAELNSEMLALQTYDAPGSVRLIDADPRKGILLLERLTPGRMLSELEFR